jgi:DNA-binding CsgD family transcriptional regulator
VVSFPKQKHEDSTQPSHGVMTRTETDLVRLLSMVYAAGLGEQPWNVALDSIAKFFHAAGTVLFDLDRANGRIPVIFTQGVEQGQGEYVDRMNAINPRVRFALSRPGCHTSFDYEALPEAAIRRHEFYAWLERTCDLKYFIGSRMIDAGDLTTLCSVEFTPRQGHPERHQIDTFKALTPHIANAWRVSRMRAQSAAASAFSEALQEQMQWGVIALDRLGRIVSMNRCAQDTTARADGLVVQRGALRALRASEDRTLKLSLAFAMRAAHGESTYPGAAFAIPRCSGRQPYAVRILPVRHGTASVSDDAPVVLLFIHDPDARATPRVEDLRAFFGLTGREAELALLVVGGVPLRDAAERMGIARNTARVHLANILHKTGARSQATLVRLIGGLPVHRV